MTVAVWPAASGRHRHPASEGGVSVTHGGDDVGDEDTSDAEVQDATPSSSDGRVITSSVGLGVLLSDVHDAVTVTVVPGVVAAGLRVKESRVAAAEGTASATPRTGTASAAVRSADSEWRMRTPLGPDEIALSVDNVFSMSTVTIHPASSHRSVGKVRRVVEERPCSVKPVRSPWLDALMLLDRVSVAMTTAIAEAVGEAGATNQGVQVLYWLQDESPLNQSDLVERLEVDRAQVSRLLTTLQRRGLVERRVDPRHPRARTLRITRKGRAGIRRYEAAMAAALLEQTDTIRGLLSLLGVQREPVAPTPVRVVVEHMAVAGQRFTAGMAPNAVKHGFGGPENGRVLRVIGSRGRVRPSEIADALGVRLPRVSKATAVLEGRGLITRSHPPAGDRRKVLLELTPQGRTALLHTIEAFREHAHVVIDPFVEALWVEPATAAGQRGLVGAPGAAAR